VNLRYKFDPNRWRLGKPCKHNHFWPGTELSLRSSYVSPAGEAVPHCAACKGGDFWLLKFVDESELDLPPKFRLGRPCPHGHSWEDTPFNLRYRRGGHCLACEQAKESSYDPVRAHAWYERNKEKHKQQQIKKRAERKQDGRHQEWLDRTREARRLDKEKYRRQQGRPTREEMRLRASLRKQTRFTPSSTVAQLVHQQQLDYWREHPDEHKQAKGEERRVQWRLRYMTDAQLRSYNREKTRRRKARMRQSHQLQVRPRQIRQRFAQFNDSCAYCGATGDLHIEHFIPVSKGGPHVIGNIIPACQPCNYSKRNYDPEEWYHRQEFFSTARWQLILQVLGKKGASVHQLPLL
jgi:5-methylcytosine-specific restriction endonuclease McrA